MTLIFYSDFVIVMWVSNLIYAGGYVGQYVSVTGLLSLRFRIPSYLKPGIYGLLEDILIRASFL